MKNPLYACAFLLILCSMRTTFGWTLYVTNWVNRVVNIHTSWAGSGWAFGKCFSCCDDRATLQPGQRIAINAGECLLTELRVDGGTPYKSSGQRAYNEFYIIGPVHGQLYAGRIAGRGDASNISKKAQGELLNATPFPVTNVKIDNENEDERKEVYVQKPQNIASGENFVLDLGPDYYVKRIEATINGKDIALESLGANRRNPRWIRGNEFFISGPPDGSNPQIIELIQ